MIDEDEREMFLDAIREGPTPFDRFVSRGDIKEVIDIPNPRQQAERGVFRAIQQTINDVSTRFIPLLGPAGAGKTHFYWVLKDKQHQIPDLDFTTVYVSSPPSPVRILLHLYTCFMDEVGLEILDIVSDRLVDYFDGKKRRFKIFGPSIDDVTKKAVRMYPGIGADVVKAIITLKMGNNDIVDIAESWLLGESINEEEMERLGVNTLIEEDDVCLATLKLLTENITRPIVFYFDELEMPYRIFGDEAEIRLWETIKRIYNETKNVVIVAACLDDVWERVESLADAPMKSRMEATVCIKPFTVDDIENFYKAGMDYLWDSQNLPPPPDKLFPLNDRIFERIFEKSNGNPRETIKLIRKALDEVLDPSMVPELTVEFPTVPEITVEGEKEVIEIPTTSMAFIGEIPEEEIIALDVNPGSISGSAMTSLMTVAKQLDKEDEINFIIDFEFKVKGKPKKISGAIKFDNALYGIEVPSVKTFEKPGGVAAYYAVKRLDDALKESGISKAFLIVPKGTSGAKYTQISESLGDNLIKIELSQEEAEELIQKSRIEPIEQVFPLIKTIFPEYEPEEEEEVVEEESEQEQ